MFGNIKKKLYEIWSNKIFPSDPATGTLGSIDLILSLIQFSGIPLLGTKTESRRFKVFVVIYGIIVMTLATFTYTGLEIYDMITSRGSLYAFTQNACLTITHASGAIKALNVLYRRKQIIRSIEQCRMLVKKYVIYPKEKEAFFRGEFENKILFSCYVGMVGLTAFIATTMLMLNPRNIAGKIFPFKVKILDFLPYNIQIVYMATAVLLCAAQIVGVDFLNITLINDIRYQMKVLNIAFDRLAGNVSTDPNRAIKSLVEHHNLILRARKEVEDIFNYQLLLQLLVSLVIFALTGFQATVQSESSGAVVIYFYSGCISFELFAFCWFGNAVSEQNTTLAFRGYNSSWFDFGIGYQKSLIIFLMNAQRPFQFTAGGFLELSLVTFSKILSKSYTYLALLRQFYAEK